MPKKGLKGGKTCTTSELSSKRENKNNYEGDLYDIPDGVAGRFWLRKPTKEESEAVEWLPEKKEEGDDE